MQRFYCDCCGKDCTVEDTGRGRTEPEKCCLQEQGLKTFRLQIQEVCATCWAKIKAINAELEATDAAAVQKAKEQTAALITKR